MPQQTAITQKFLDEFTKEIIMTLALRLKEQERLRLEEQRRLARIELEKLKQKFKQYEVKKPEPKKIEQAVIKPVQRQIIQTPVIQQPAVQIKLQPGEINFGRILPLIRDPNVSYIECQGEGKNIIIRRSGNTISTQIILSKDEIRKIIESFSDKARIPLMEGMLNARVDNLEMSAVVSEIISPSFIIKKLNMPQMPQMHISASANVQPSKGFLQQAPTPQYSKPQNIPQPIIRKQ